MTGFLASLFPNRFGTAAQDEVEEGLRALQDELLQRASRLELTGELGQPYIDRQGAPTAVVPVTVYLKRYDSQDEVYLDHHIEFEVPTNGMLDHSEPFVQFMHAMGVSTPEALDRIEGETVDVHLDDGGNVVVDWDGLTDGASEAVQGSASDTSSDGDEESIVEEFDDQTDEDTSECGTTGTVGDTP
jgi:hypothetical protein